VVRLDAVHLGFVGRMDVGGIGLWAFRCWCCGQCLDRHMDQGPAIVPPRPVPSAPDGTGLCGCNLDAQALG
jgi:predicted nicotinamide N-methyase